MDDDGIPKKRQRLEKLVPICDNFSGNEDSSSEESSSHVGHDDDDDDEWSDSSFDKSDDFEEEVQDEDNDIRSKTDLKKIISSNDDRLHTAVKENDPKLLEEILKEGVDIDAPDENGDTALHIAVKRQKIHFVRCLLRYGADITTRTSYMYQKNYTPLHIAAELKRPDIAKILLTVKPDFTTTRKIRNKLFQFALWRKNFKLMNYLNGNVAFNSKCTRKIRKTQSLISLGVMGYSHDMIKLMMGNYSDINLVTEKGESALQIAVRKGDVDMLKLLLKNGASPHAPGSESHKWYSGFHTAAEMNRVDIMKIFMDHHFDKDDATEEGITALHIAVINKNVDLVKILLSWNVNVNVKAMYYNLKGYTPLHMAVVENSLEIIKLLMDTKGIDIRATNDNKETALHIATRKQFRDIIEYLLKFDVDINAKSGLPSQNGYTPLHIAAEKKNNEIINILLSHGADINAVTAKGEYGIHIAIHSRDLDIIQNFLSHGVDIDHKTRAGESLLHIAVCEGAVRIVVFLLAKGANIDLRTPWGLYPLDIAINCDYLDLMRILLNAGANISFLPSYPFESSDTFNTFKRHVIKLTTANVPLENLSRITSWFFSSGKKMEKYRSKCAKEVELLKKSKIGSSNISYYEILVKDVEQLARCAKNIDIIETLVPENVIEKFPLYGYLVMSRFIKGMRRREMVKKVEPLLLDVLHKLPPIVVGIIIDYLSDEDLKKISKGL